MERSALDRAILTKAHCVDLDSVPGFAVTPMNANAVVPLRPDVELGPLPAVIVAHVRRSEEWQYSSVVGTQMPRTSGASGRAKSWTFFVLDRFKLRLRIHYLP